MAIVTIPSAGQFGLVKDQPPHELAVNAWSSAENVRFRDNCIERIEGETQIYDTPAVTPYWVTPYSTTAKRYIAHFGLAAAYVDDGTTRTDITGTAPTGAVDDRWTGGSFNGFLIANNGVDKPFSWDGNTANNLTTLSAWNANHRAAVIRPFKNYLVALDVTKSGTRYPHMVKVSSAADPGALPASWDETNPSVDTYENDLAETPDLLVDALPLGGSLIIYKERSMYSMTYIGGQYIWQFNRLPGESGMLARGCAVNTPLGHVVLTAGDLVLHAGQEPQSIVDGKVRRWLFNSINTTYYTRSFVVSNPARNEVWVCFPSGTASACNKALIWNWKTNTFTTRTLNNATYGCNGQVVYSTDLFWSGDSGSWDSDVSSWDQTSIPPSEARLVLCTTEPKLVMTDSGSTLAGTSFTASAEKLGNSFDDPSNVKLVRSVIPRVDGTNGQTLYIQVGATMDPETSYTWSDPVSYVIGTDYKADTFASGRFIGIRIYSTDAFSWRVRSFDLDVTKRGRY